MTPEQFERFRSPEVQAKRLKTKAKNASVSIGQKRLYEILVSFGVPFLQEHYLKTKKTWAFADAFIPSLGLDIEYDGHHSHSTPEGKASDAKRDADLLELHDVHTLRIGRKEIFTEHALNRIATSVLEHRQCK